ncbi:thioredoxin-like protein YLS8 [Histomonas meleagridis]|uniref:thioredoxin-like protein YLS8 n=1 Tax=Histomonas meleagridis TaxID=135588 RepID=UPI00355A4332|nr:thioredoxin-like protein YLS8 [Histomonas meleagridis]KAH0798533.1 thioredoxin-like protein YLS8 [Histomonas meleagridis]
MSFLLTHLHTGWDVDQAILWEKEKLVVIRFGHDTDSTCMKMDEMLASVAEYLKNFVVIYVVDITEVPYFNTMYELNDPCSTMFFFRNKLVQVDFGTGDNYKMNFLMKTKQEFIDICELIYRTVTRGDGLVKSIINYASNDSRYIE